MIEPKPKTFYKDIAIGGLYFYLGKFSNGAKDHVFDASVGQRIISQSRFEKEMEEITDMNAYLQKNPQEKRLVERYKI